MAAEQDAGALLTLEDIRVFGPAQRRLFALCALMWGMSASFWFTGMQFLLPAVKGKWGLPSRWQGLYASVFYSGMVVGGVVFGRMADRHGRRPVLLACVAMASGFGMAAGVAVDATMLVGCLLLQGVGCGGVLPLGSCIFGECCPVHCRGKYLSLLGMTIPGGAIVGCGLAWSIVPRADAAWNGAAADSWSWGWRVLYLVMGGMGLVLLAVLCAALPESARYLLGQGREAEAQEVLRGLVAEEGLVDKGERGAEERGDESTRAARGLAKKESEAKASLLEVQEEAGAGEGAAAEGGGGSSSSAGIGALFSPQLRLTTALLWLIWFGTSFGANGFNVYLPTMLKNKGIGAGQVYQDTLIYSAAGVPGAIAASQLVELKTVCGMGFGRRMLIGGALALTAGSVALFGATGTEAELVVFSCFFNLFSNGVWAALYTFTPEAYPTSVRGTGVGMCTSLSSLAGILAPLFAGVFVDVDSGLVVATFVAMIAVGAGVSTLLPRERGGEKLQERLIAD